MEKDYYLILGVNPNASQEEIREAYRFKVFALHPDRFSQADAKVRRRAEEELKAINEAYAVLGDPLRRAEYDRRRVGSREPFASPHMGDARANPASPQTAPRFGPRAVPPELLQSFLYRGLRVVLCGLPVLLLAYLLSLVFPPDWVRALSILLFLGLLDNPPRWVDTLAAILIYPLYTRGRRF